MTDRPSSNPSPQDLSLSDRLAIDRTVLANERTLLAYVRTALGLLALGVAFLDYVTGRVYTIAGGILIVSGPLVLLAGVIGFFRVRRRLATLSPAPAGRVPAGGGRR